MKQEQTTPAGARTQAADNPKDTTTETVHGLLSHAREDARLAELTASRAGHWHSAEDCANIRIAIEKALASIVI